ncbi:hypothetical protein WJX72_006142 [[Myrmecia] bisecta]|uniref:Uncharacterized protein n=1 Tax=[Myrmecia] bisecta TaxID=41462 RepID=A0AAW1PP52_9CHLO
MRLAREYRAAAELLERQLGETEADDYEQAKSHGAYRPPERQPGRGGLRISPLSGPHTTFVGAFGAAQCRKGVHRDGQVQHFPLPKDGHVWPVPGHADRLIIRMANTPDAQLKLQANAKAQHANDAAAALLDAEACQIPQSHSDAATAPRLGAKTAAGARQVSGRDNRPQQSAELPASQAVPPFPLSLQQVQRLLLEMPQLHNLPAQLQKEGATEQLYRLIAQAAAQGAFGPLGCRHPTPTCHVLLLV